MTRHRLRARRAAALGGLALAGLWLVGCNLFQPRPAQPPDSGNTLYVTYVDPESTLATMASGIQDRTSAGQDAYVAALAESLPSGNDGAQFHAFFDAAVLAQWVGNGGKTPPSDWTRVYERFFIGRLSGLDPDTVIWEPDLYNPNDTQVPPNGVTKHRHYVIRAAANSGSVVGDTIAIGYADLTFLHSGAKWVLTRWQDRVDPAIGVNPLKGSQKSFSELRLENF